MRPPIRPGPITPPSLGCRAAHPRPRPPRDCARTVRQHFRTVRRRRRVRTPAAGLAPPRPTPSRAPGRREPLPGLRVRLPRHAGALPGVRVDGGGGEAGGGIGGGPWYTRPHGTAAGVGTTSWAVDAERGDGRVCRAVRGGGGVVGAELLDDGPRHAPIARSCAVDTHGVRRHGVARELLRPADTVVGAGRAPLAGRARRVDALDRARVARPGRAGFRHHVQLTG